MAATSSRTLRLLSLLQTHRHWPGAELAARLEVSPRTLRRDVDRLRELGYPVRASRGVDGGYQLAAGASLPPLVLDDDEAVALAVGLQAAAHASVAGVAEASVRALAKVVPVLPARLRKRVEALRTMTEAAGWTADGDAVDPDVLTTVAQACRDAVELSFDYSAADGARTQRRVEPHRLVSLGRRWYLVAYDPGRADWRCFRLDRIDRLTAPRASGTHFRPRRLLAPDAATFVRERTGHRATSYDVAALVDAPAAAARARVGRWCTVEPDGEQRCRVSMRTESLDWALLALGSLGADFEVLEPPALLDHLSEWTARFTRAVAR